MPLLLPLLLPVLLLASPQAPKTNEKPPAKTEVKAAISKTLKTPAEAKDTDLRTVVRFARFSDECLVNIIAGLVPVPKTKEHQLLLGYHVAGAVQYDLDHPKLKNDTYTDKEAAVRASFVAYKFLQSRKNGYKDPTMEKLVAADKKGTLKSYIKSVIQAATKKK